MAKHRRKPRVFYCWNCGKTYEWNVGDYEGCPNCRNNTWAQEEIKDRRKKSRKKK